MNVLALPLSFPPVALKPGRVVRQDRRDALRQSSRSVASSLQAVPAEIAFSSALQLSVTAPS